MKNEKLFKEMLALLEAINYSYTESHFISATLQIAMTNIIERAREMNKENPLSNEIQEVFNKHHVEDLP